MDLWESGMVSVKKWVASLPSELAIRVNDEIEKKGGLSSRVEEQWKQVYEGIYAAQGGITPVNASEASYQELVKKMRTMSTWTAPKKLRSLFEKKIPRYPDLLNQPNLSGKTPLHFLAMQKTARLIGEQNLSGLMEDLKSGKMPFDLFCQDMQGRSPLAEAFSSWNWEAFIALLKAGADPRRLFSEREYLSQSESNETGVMAWKEMLFQLVEEPHPELFLMASCYNPSVLDRLIDLESWKERGEAGACSFLHHPDELLACLLARWIEEAPCRDSEDLKRTLAKCLPLMDASYRSGNEVSFQWLMRKLCPLHHPRKKPVESAFVS